MKTKIEKLQKLFIEDLEVQGWRYIYSRINDYKIIKETPSKPKMPVLVKNATIDQVKEYTVKLTEYTDLMEKWKSTEKAREYTNELIDEHNSIIYKGIEDAVKEEAGLDMVPKQYRDKVWSHAWENGHSAGLSEVHGCLVELVEIFV